MTRASVVLLLGCLAAMPGTAGPVSCRDRQFIGPDGNPVILRGLNVAQSAKRAPYLPWQKPEHFVQMSQWGCNCLRLLIVWAAVEPQPGKYDDQYLASVRQRLDWAQQAGLYVILDMHQDLYGEKYGGDGAPQWACVDNGAAFDPQPGQHWAANYFQPAVMVAFDSFWQDAPGPDGVGLQEHFVRVWRHVAEKLGDHPAVIGYDLLNEPYYGNVLGYPEAFAVMLQAQSALPAGANLLALFTPARSEELQEVLADPARFFSILDLANDLFRRFEQERLMPLYERVVRELRQVTPEAIFFLEPHIGAASGAKTFLTQPQAPDGPVRIAYAPHFYDPGCSPSLPYDGNPARARTAFQRIQEVSQRLEAPVLLGEWGDAESPAQTAQHYLRDQAQLLREFGFSHCYWQYGPQLPRRPAFPTLLEVLGSSAE